MATLFITFVVLLFRILSLAIFISVLLSWIDPTGNMRFTLIMREITEPILAPIRRLLPSMGMIDISPFIAMLLLNALGQLVASVIH